MPIDICIHQLHLIDEIDEVEVVVDAGTNTGRLLGLDFLSSINFFELFAFVGKTETFSFFFDISWKNNSIQVGFLFELSLMNIFFCLRK